MLSEIPDLASGQVWPGAMARTLRNRCIERWAGREWALRQNYQEAGKAALAVRQAGDVAHAAILIGQDAGLIEMILPARAVIQRMVVEAEEIIASRLPTLLQRSQTHTPTTPLRQEVSA